MTQLFLVLLTLLTLTQISFAAAPHPVVGSQSMVVSAQKLATHIGDQIIDQGGNAIDAAVAVGYALAVVHPCCGNIGGGGFMTIRLADGSTHFINFRERAPLAATPNIFQDGNYKKNPYLEIAVPGTVKGLNYALKTFGTMPLNKIMEPAIKLAQNGFPLSRTELKLFSDVLKKNPGKILKQENLAATLQQISRHGDHEFYHGNIADRIVDSMKKHNGLITKKDLQQYTTQELNPITCHYRGYEIITAPPPSAGGIAICQILNVLEQYPLKKLGYKSAASTHIFIEAQRHTFADRSQKLGDPDFVNNPTQELISKNYAQKIKDQINKNKATDSNTLKKSVNKLESHNTTGYVIVDKQGNAVAVTYTLNSLFGAKVMAKDTGFYLNNEMDDFNLEPGKPNLFGLIGGEPNIVAPGKRPLSSMAPTIVTKNNKLFMVISTPGGSTIPTQIVGVITNVIDYGMNIQEAIDAPRIHMQWLPDVTFYEPYALSPDTIAILKKMGHTFKEGAYFGAKRWGGVMAILVDPKTGELHGGKDSRRPSGSAIGN